MSAPSRNISDLLYRARKSFTNLATGGDWAIALGEKTRQNLVWFWFDGFFAAACDNIAVTYLAVYLLALGATQAQIGLTSSLSSLGAAAVLLPGAMLVERYGRRKQLAVLGGVGARLVLGALALLPVLIGGPGLIYLALGISLLRDGFGNLGFPAWMAITADVVPIAGRGRYFASRNFIMSIGGMATTLAMGVMISRMVQPVGYQIALVVALVLGAGSTFSFARLRDARSTIKAAAAPALSLTDLVHDLTANRPFLILMMTTALWNFSLNIAGPFFNLYLVQKLNASAAMLGVTSIASAASTLLSQRKLGELADRWGSRKLQLICGLLIPVLPLSWAFARSPWHIVIINLVGGVFWAGYTLASFNYLLELTPPERRARFSALYQIIVTLGLSGGAAFGSLLVSQWGYIAVFIGSTVGRIIAAILFARFSQGTRAAVQTAPAFD